MASGYRAGAWWENCLSQNFDLRGAGHQGFSRWYNLWLYQAKLQGFIRACRLANVTLGGTHMLEVGPGTGWWTRLFREWGVTALLGLDIAPTSVATLAHQFPEFEFRHGDVSESVPAGPYDVITVFDVFEHIVDDRRLIAALKNLTTCLDPDAALIVTDNFGATRAISPVPEVRLRHSQTYFELFASAGLQLAAIVPNCVVLNKIFPDGPWPSRMRKAVAEVDNMLAPLLYAFDVHLSPYLGRFANHHTAIFRLATR